MSGERLCRLQLIAAGACIVDRCSQCLCVMPSSQNTGLRIFAQGRAEPHRRRGMLERGVGAAYIVLKHTRPCNSGTCTSLTIRKMAAILYNELYTKYSIDSLICGIIGGNGVRVIEVNDCLATVGMPLC